MYMMGYNAESMGERLVDCISEGLYSRTICMNLAQRIDLQYFSDNRTVNTILEWEAGRSPYRAEEFGCDTCGCGESKNAECFGCDTCGCGKSAEEFGAEFSKGDLKKLKKYIDFPTRWINKETAPTSETKRRKAKNKFVGTLPAQKGIEGMKYDIKTPTWFKGIQLGILATIFGAMYVGETKKKGKK